MPHPSNVRGFTLIELMVTLVIMAILMAFALPSFRDTIRRGHVSSSSNALLAALSYARSEAISRSQLVSMCASTDGTTCSGSKAYELGWLVYTYPASTVAPLNTTYAAASATLLRVTDAQTGVSIQSADTGVVTFGQQGQLDPTNTTPATTLKFVICSRTDSSGTGASTSTVPGTALDANPSGSVTTQAWPVGTACTR
ncbi:MAG: GspH/FimT family pseudopilin [Rhodanobacter sp.]